MEAWKPHSRLMVTEDTVLAPKSGNPRKNTTRGGQVSTSAELEVPCAQGHVARLQ